MFKTYILKTFSDVLPRIKGEIITLILEDTKQLIINELRKEIKEEIFRTTVETTLQCIDAKYRHSNTNKTFRGIDTVRDSFRKKLLINIDEYVEQSCKIQLQLKMYEEKFITEIVKRINDNQLKKD